MPTTKRTRKIDAPVEEIWGLLEDPHHLPRWWPGVQRVEDASATAWTKVLSTGKGKSVRADYTRTRADRLRSVTWQQEVDETPFARILREASIEINLDPVDQGSTRVELRAVQKLRGVSRFGSPAVSRATARQLVEALEGLAAITEARAS